MIKLGIYQIIYKVAIATLHRERFFCIQFEADGDVITCCKVRNRSRVGLDLLAVEQGR